MKKAQWLPKAIKIVVIFFLQFGSLGVGGLSRHSPRIRTTIFLSQARRCTRPLRRAAISNAEEDDVWLNIRSADLEADDSILLERNVSISNLVSTPQLFAQALNMTIQDVYSKRLSHDLALQRLHVSLRDKKDLSGEDKHSMLCQHRFVHGRDPFVCKTCWSHLPICICTRATSRSITRPKGIYRVIIWMHRDEWGKTSNTGSVLGAIFGKDVCEILMKGLPQHDQRMAELLQDESIRPVVLWPDIRKNGAGRRKKTETQQHVWTTVADIQNYLNLTSIENCTSDSPSRDRRLVIIAVDGSWRNARRMVSKLPQRVERLDLTIGRKKHDSDTKIGVGDSDDKVPTSFLGSMKESILAPLRRQGVEGESSNVCTAEAVVEALFAFGMPKEDCEHVLSVTKAKIDLTMKYQGKIS